jgi:hypothetical protein
MEPSVFPKSTEPKQSSKTVSSCTAKSVGVVAANSSGRKRKRSVRLAGNAKLKRDKIIAMVSLGKIVDGKSAADTLPNQVVVTCPRCEQTYRLGTSDEEWNKIQPWLKLAEMAIRASHLHHAADSLQLIWKARRGPR